MAAYENVREVSVLVAVDANGVAAVNKFRFARFLAGGAERQVEKCPAGAEPSGIIAMKVATKYQPGQAYIAPAVPMAVPNGGLPIVEAGAAIAAIDTPLAVDAQGRAIAAVAGNVIVGRNTEPATAAGQIIAIQFKPEGIMPA